MSWRKVKLEEFMDAGGIDIQTGPFGTQLKASDYTAEGTPVINVRNVGYGNLRPDKLEFVPDQVSSRLSVHILQMRDIVFGRKGAVDRHLVVTESEAGWMQGSDCIRLRVKTDKINPKFLSYALRLPTHKQWMITQCSNKATMASLNHDVISRITVFLPDLTTQDRIASILSAYDDLIENNRRRIQLLEQAARLLYKEWFVHLRFPGHEHTKIHNGIPEGWTIRRLSDIATKIGSGATPRGGAAAYQSEGITLIRSQNIYDYQFEDAGLTYINEDQAEKLSAVTVEPSDILLNITGASVGRCCVIPERHLPARVNQHVMIIRVDPQQCSPQYLLHFINSHQQKQLLLSIARTGGATREALTKDVVQNIYIPMPSVQLLEQFEETASRIFIQQQLLGAQNNKLATARDLFLPRLMNGEVAV